MIKKLRNQPYAPKWEQEKTKKSYRPMELRACRSERVMKETLKAYMHRHILRLIKDIVSTDNVT
jgi:hypothetical protein